MLKHIIGLWLFHYINPWFNAAIALFLVEFWFKHLTQISVCAEALNENPIAIGFMVVFGIIHLALAVDYYSLGELELND